MCKKSYKRLYVFNYIDIRSYNSSLSFASLGVKLDLSLANMRSGSYTFHIQGSPYHLIGSALPEDGATPKFAQIYIHDSANELQNRASIFPDINMDTLKQLQDLMHTMNPLLSCIKICSKLLKNNTTITMA